VVIDRGVVPRRSLVLTAGCLLCIVGVGAATPAARPPRGTIVFASDRTGTSHIYSIGADGTRLGQLTRGKAADTAPLFSPDGRRIVFTRSPRGDRSGNPVSELWVMNADGGGRRKLAASGSAPAWSPNSRRIAYVAATYRSRGAAPIAIKDLDGGHVVVIPGKNGNPYWSPNGTLIAFSRVVGDGERTDLAVVGSDGRRPRTIRRRAAALGWSPGGDIAFTGQYGSGVGLISADGRHARRLLRTSRYAFVWSPDGRRLAFVDGKGLHVASATGRNPRNVPPKNPNLVGSPAWSPDSRWIAVAFAPNGTTLADLLLVAADGSSSRRLTARVPRPWGTDYSAPSWRPRAATGERLGSRPEAPLPLESVSASSFRPGAQISELAADGGLVAVVVEAKPRICAGIEAWEPARRRFARLALESCGDNGALYQPAHGLAVAGRHVAWLGVGGGMTLETRIVTTTPDRPNPVALAEELADEGGFGDTVGEPVGHDGLLGFTVSHRCDEHPSGGPPGDCPPGRKGGDVVEATVWRLGGGTPCAGRYAPRLCTAVARADGRLTVLAVDAGRVAARTDGGVRLLSVAGKALRDLPVAATAAALSGGRLALRVTDAVEIYDAGTGQRTDRIPLAKAATLEDLEGDILVTASADTVTLRRLGDGRTLTLRTDGRAKAALERPGLYLAGAHRVAFTPMRDILRRLAAP
jgi:Tol biopolymer transport system component